MKDVVSIAQAIAALEAHREILGYSVVEKVLAVLRKELTASRAAWPVQHKEITVLVAGISGVDALLEHMPPQEKYQMLNTLWVQLDSAVSEHGGHIEKHIGNTLIAFFGGYSHRENEPEWGVRAALAMQSAWRQTLSEWEEQKGGAFSAQSLHLRVGINTGPALLGPVGTTGDDTALGQAATVAWMLQMRARADTILLAYQTYQYVKGVFYTQPVKPLSEAIIGQTLPVYALKGAKPHAIRVIARGVEGIETRMVGRESGFLTLKDAFYQVLGKMNGQIITIVGESGVGKSRLLYEFDKWLAQLPVKMSFFQGRASVQTSQLPFWVIRDLFSFYFGITASDSIDVTRKKLSDGITDLLDFDAGDMPVFIGQLVGFDFSDDLALKPLAHAPQQIYDRAVAYTVQFFTGIAVQKSPVVIILEDFHWADSASVEFVAHLAQSIKDTPLLIICSAQPSLLENHPDWGESWSNHTLIELSALSAADSETLVNELLQKLPETPARLKDALITTSQGNPFFIEELVKHLVEQWVILTGPGQWSVNAERLASLDLPHVLHDLLKERLKQLPLLEREILQQASVIGRAFWPQAIVQIRNQGGGGLDASVLDVVLNGLQKKEFILQREASAFSGASEYVFKHALLQSVTYQSIPEIVRAESHARIAAWLIEQNGEQVDVYAALVADHFAKAGKLLAAARWFTRAGRQAQGVYAPNIAWRHYRHALKHWQSLDTVSVGDALMQAEAYSGAVAAGLWLVQRADGPRSAESLIDSVADTARDFLDIAQKTERPAWLANAWHAVAQVAAFVNQHLSATAPTLPDSFSAPADAFRRSAALFEELSDTVRLADVLQHWANFELAQNHNQQSQALLKRIQAIQSETDDSRFG